MKKNSRITNHISRITFHFLLSTLLLSCAAPTPTATPQPFAPFIMPTRVNLVTATPFQPVIQTDTPIPTYTASPIPSTTPTATLTPPPTTPVTAATTQAPPPPTNSSRPNYILFATLDFANKTITADQTIRYYNNTGTTLSDLVLSVQPNTYTGNFSLNALAQDGTALTSYTLSGQRLTINLNQAISSGTATTLTLTFTLNIPQKSSGNVFGYDFNQINLVNWYPSPST